jgi:hypothetical protein
VTKDEERRLAEKFREFGHLLGTTYGAKGAETTNHKLDEKQRKANAKKASAASVEARMKWSAAKRKRIAREAVQERWRRYREAKAKEQTNGEQ